jgi:hypothetical protein
MQEAPAAILGPCPRRISPLSPPATQTLTISGADFILFKIYTLPIDSLQFVRCRAESIDMPIKIDVVDSLSCNSLILESTNASFCI